MNIPKPKPTLREHKVLLRRTRVTYDDAISLTTYHDEQRDVPDESLDPYAVLRAKTIGLAELLHCTEEEAERIILQRCDA